MTKQTLLSLALAAGAVATSCSNTAHAYVTHSRWDGNSATMRASSVSFPSGSSFRTSLSTVVSRFNENPSNFRFTQLFNDTSVSLYNGQSETWFSSDSSVNPAVTFYSYNWWTGRLIEADVVFWSGVSYTTSMSKTNLIPYGGSNRPFQTTAMHEYGHAAGLSHEDDEYNIMGQDWTHLSLNGSACRSYVGEDACDGLADTYGNRSGSNVQDVGVVHWKWSGRNGEYSTHALTQMFTTGGSVIGNGGFNGQRRYNVNRGQQVQVEFSYENNGESTQRVNVAFYISTNSFISTGDTRIATTSMNLGRNSVSTTRRTVTIPSNLNRNQTYYLGAIIDWDGGLGEVTGSNNAAYHIIRIN